MMKKILLLVMMSLAIACTFSACSNNDSDGNNKIEYNPLVGTWSIESGGWIYIFNKNYTFTELFVEEPSNSRFRTDGTYAIDRDVVYFKVGEYTDMQKFCLADPSVLVLNDCYFYKLEEE